MKVFVLAWKYRVKKQHSWTCMIPIATETIFTVSAFDNIGMNVFSKHSKQLHWLRIFHYFNLIQVNSIYYRLSHFCSGMRAAYWCYKRCATVAFQSIVCLFFHLIEMQICVSRTYERINVEILRSIPNQNSITNFSFASHIFSNVIYRISGRNTPKTSNNKIDLRNDKTNKQTNTKMEKFHTSHPIYAHKKRYLHVYV